MLLRSRRRLTAQEEAARETVSRRRTRARPPDQISGFPLEMLHEILVRLPPKSVLRCRAVCRSWHRLASDPAFLLDHHRCQPELHLFSSSPTARGAGYDRRLQAVHLRSAEVRPIFMFPQLFIFRIPFDASCDGLFVSGCSICNPATRQWAPLSSNPKQGFGSLVGCYWHQPSGEYRVLYWTSPSFLKPLTLPVLPSDILTVGASESRLVDCPLTQMIGALGPVICGAPVLLNGSLYVHWKLRRGVRYHKILVFDTVAETFRQMVPSSVNPCHAMHLLDMSGRLAAATRKDSVSGMSIFVLQDREHDIWAFHYRIKLPMMEIRRLQEQGSFWAEVVSEHGDVIVSCYGRLLHCDKNGSLVAIFKYDDDDMPVVLRHRLKQSLVQHAFFQKIVN